VRPEKASAASFVILLLDKSMRVTLFTCANAPAPTSVISFCSNRLERERLSIEIHTYHSRIPEVVAEASQIILQDAHVSLNYLAMSTADVTGGKPIAV
jgi:hypothetical protein